jgi:2-methylisocitrate lyase-like PEP mutase family enzyme
MATTTRLARELIEADEILVQPGIYDGFSARLVQQMGFKSAAISGAGLNETSLGWADVGLTGQEENLHAFRANASWKPERPDLAVSFRELNELKGFVKYSATA